MQVGYARTSTADQIYGLEGQLAQLASIGVDKVFSEQVSSLALRDQLEAALEWVRTGDVFVVTRMDRLARSTSDLLRIVQRLDDKEVALRVLDFGGSVMDTQSPTGKLILVVLAAIAEFERSLMVARQREGIERAKAAGRYRGRAPTAKAKASQVLDLHRLGVRPTEIATRVGISRASVYRLIAEAA
ncbi:MAG: recombinase family protein [Alphaproteobacteria bacterium]|nr:MAG: recombinase family protein [Alphaproteobacteria bacterium]